MIRALWTAANGMEAQQITQDVTANNLANINTVGFKRRGRIFRTSCIRSIRSRGPRPPAGPASGGDRNRHGVKLVSVQKMFTQGDYMQTDNKVRSGHRGDGFFQIDDDGDTVYTRAGSFRTDSEGVLCNSEGLKLIPEVTIPDDTVNFTVDSGGTWTATDEFGNSLGSGRIELAKFINPAGLTSLGRNLYAQTEGSGEATTGYPGETGFGTLSQNFLEMSSSVNVVEEMVKMIVGQRACEINSKAIQTADSMMQVVNNLKR